MSSKLDPVQIAALDFARNKRGVGWFLQQGLGKTLCALKEFEEYFEINCCDQMISVCPNSFKSGWLDEIDKHGFHFHTHIFQSAKKKEADIFLRQYAYSAPPVLILNYEALRIQSVLAVVCQWAARGKTYLAIDESIQIKGPRSLQTRAVHRLASQCRFVRLLTGRPQTQGPHDLWGQLRAIGLYQATNFFAFRNFYCIMGGWRDANGQFKDVVGAKNVEHLAQEMAPHVFQAKKADWLPSLPRKDYTIRDYEMSLEQRRQYNQMEREFLLEIERGFITVDVAIAKYEKLAQIQTGFIYDDDKTVHQLVDLEANPRLNLLRQMLEEEIEGKTCIVYKHRAVLDFLLRALVDYYPVWISGGMEPAKTDEQKRTFNEKTFCRVILLQCDAAKYGHTLLGGPGADDKCRTMIFFENSYSADTRDQIEDRIHRRGQTGESVLYIDLSGSDLDRRIVRALQLKDKMYKSVFRNLRSEIPQTHPAAADVD